MTRFSQTQHKVLIPLMIMALAAVLAACAGAKTAATAAETCVPMESAVLHNLIRVDERLYSGSEPHGAESFAALRDLGVKTIVSVDGAQPDVEGARAAGIRYVHLPMGYDTVPREVESGMARLLREESGPIYVHCHHGKHRGPAAAAVLWSLKSGQGGGKTLKLMEVAKTSEAYAGLWKSVREFEPRDVKPQSEPLHEVAPVDDFAGQMAKIDRVWDHLVAMEANGWRPDPAHPDLDPANESLILAEGFRELMRLKGNDFELPMWAQMEAGTRAASELHAAVRSRNPELATALLADLKNRCNKCHVEYRN